jgi:DHA1 family multidrug resistance protein-like MFS transporter
VIGGTLAHSVGLRGAFLVSAGVYLAAFLLVLVGYREAEARRNAGQAIPPKVTFAEIRGVPHFLLFMGAVFGMQLADRSLGPILPLYLREIGVASDNVAFLAGILFTITAGFAAIGNLSSRWLLTRRSEGVLVAVMAAVASAAALVFAAGAPVTVLLGAAAGFGLAVGVATTSIYTVASQAVSAERRGSAFAYLTSAYLVGLAVSPVVAGFIGSVSMRAVFLADAAGLALVAWLVKRGMVDAER